MTLSLIRAAGVVVGWLTAQWLGVDLPAELMGVALFGGSDSTSSTSNTTETFNLGLNEVSGPAAATARGDVEITASDQGAIEAARDVALESIYAGQVGLEEGYDFGRAVVAAGADQNREVAGVLSDIARDNTQFVENVGAQVIDSAERGRTEVLGFAGDTVADLIDSGREARVDVLEFADAGRSDVIGFASSVLDRTIGSIERAGQGFVTAASDVFARESSNTGARLEGISRYALIGGGLIAAAAILVPVLRR